MAKTDYARQAERLARRIERQVAQFTGPRMIRVVNEATRTLRDLLKTKYMGAGRTGAKRLARNTGKMEEKTVATRAKADANNNVSASVKINVPYASVHFGEGSKTQTVIKPKTKQALTIPLDAVKGGNKRARFPASSKQITGKFVERGVIYGRLPGAKYQLPLFALRPTVVVPVRVSIERDVQPEAKRIMTELIEKEAQKIFKGQ